MSRSQIQILKSDRKKKNQMWLQFMFPEKATKKLSSTWIWHKLMPCPFTGPKMFWAGPNFLCQTKRWFAFSKIVFCTGPKVFEEALNAVKFLGWLKKFGPAQYILGPIKGQGISEWNITQKFCGLLRKPEFYENVKLRIHKCFENFVLFWSAKKYVCARALSSDRHVKNVPWFVFLSASWLDFSPLLFDSFFFSF